jgi:hypothetical protein
VLLTQIGEFSSQPVGMLDDRVEGVGDVSRYARPIEWQSDTEIPRAQVAKGTQKGGLVDKADGYVSSIA